MGKIADHLRAHAVSAVTAPVGTVLDRLMNRAAPIQLPSPGELIALLNANFVTRRDFNRLVAYHGICAGPDPEFTQFITQKQQEQLTDLWGRVLEVSQKQFSEDDIIRLSLRNEITPKQASRFLRAKGWADPDKVDLLYNLFAYFPTGGEISAAWQDTINEPGWNQRARYTDKFPDQLRTLFDQLGMGFQLKDLLGDVYTGPNINWGDILWRQHWWKPSFREAFEMRARLKPSGAGGKITGYPPEQQFDEVDYQSHCRTLGITEYWLPKLEAVSYRPIGIRYLQRFYDTGQADFQDIVNAFAALLYRPQDCVALAKMVVASSQAEKLSSAVKSVCSKAVELYALGLLDRDKVLVLCHRANIRTKTELRAYDGSSLANQIQEARIDVSAQQDLLLAELDKAMAQARGVVAAVRTAFLRGRLSEIEARAALGLRGFDGQAVDQYLRDWILDLTPHRKEISTGQIQKYLRYGTISRAAAVLRLTNLGWAPDDINLLLADVARDITLDNQRSADKRAAKLAKSKREQERLLRQKDSERRRAMSDLAKHGNPSQLGAWYLEGIIDAATYALRMQLLGWPADDVGRKLAELDQKRAAALHKQLENLDQLPEDRIKRPTITVLKKWRKKSIITDDEFRARAADLAIPPADVERYLQEV